MRLPAFVWPIALAGISLAPPAFTDQPKPKVTILPTPHGGIQPQAAIDERGVVHLIYFSGDAKAGDIDYVHSTDSEHFSPPLRVNSEPGSAIAIGNIRGAHVALGRGGRVHVAWMGSAAAKPRGPSDAAPMLYARLNDAGNAFEPQRNLIRTAAGLDGGGSIAADGEGRVFVVWHAPEPGTKGEDHRAVWLARSADDGKTFAPEIRINPEPTGVCGCCGMRAFADHRGNVFILYRSAKDLVHRDMYLLRSTDHGSSFHSLFLDGWTVRTCPMTSMTMAEGKDGVVASWETDGQVSYCPVSATSSRLPAPIRAPGPQRGRKHSVAVQNAAGETLLAWTDGMGWNKKGALSWRLFDASGQPTDLKGRGEAAPVWSLISAYVRPDGGFAIVY